MVARMLQECKSSSVVVSTIATVGPVSATWGVRLCCVERLFLLPWGHSLNSRLSHLAAIFFEAIKGYSKKTGYSQVIASYFI
jgi:hypothetical protein